MKLNKFIDHTLLNPTANLEDIKRLCKEAIKYDFFSVCIHSCYVAYAKEYLNKSDVKICAVVGFPLGAMHTKAKAFEARNAIKEGANEIDMVINLGLLKSDKHLDVIKDISGVKEAVGDHVLKVIIETCYLNKEEKIAASDLVVKAGGDFVKTSTGFGTGGATLDDIRLIKDSISKKAKIKASGGIRDYETALKYIQLGVSRIGTSNGIAIIEGKTQQTNTY